MLGNSLERSKAKRWVATNTTDTIIAIGKPATVIKDHEHALVLAGQKYNYLIEDGSHRLKRIFESVALRYLTIDLPKSKHIAIKQSGDGFTCSSDFGCADRISLNFKKPMSQTTAQDKKHLETLGFYCYDFSNTHLECSYSSHRPALIPTQKNGSTLTHRLKQSINITLYEFHPHKGQLKRATTMLFVPLAIAFDIITFPIQAEFVDISK